jgi:zinc transport system permease protein
MENLINLISYPFVLRAIFAGIVTAALLSFLGVFVVLRKMSFFSDGIAHASLAGVAAGILLSSQPLLWAIIVGVIFAVLVYWLERRTSISVDAIIGILFTASLALGVILINFKSGYQPELISFLFGNILTIQYADIWLILAAALAIGAFMFIGYKKYVLLSLNKDMAYLSGINTPFYELMFYIALSVSVILGIKIVGVVLVSALVIIPVSIAKLFSASAKSLVVWSIVFSELVMLSGIGLSLMFNLPTGATIVLVGALLFFGGVLILKKS